MIYFIVEALQIWQMCQLQFGVQRIFFLPFDFVNSFLFNWLLTCPHPLRILTFSLTCLIKLIDQEHLTTSRLFQICADSQNFLTEFQIGKNSHIFAFTHLLQWIPETQSIVYFRKSEIFSQYYSTIYWALSTILLENTV